MDTCVCTKEGELSELKGETKAIWKRIDEQLQLNRSINELIGEVRVMNANLSHMNGRQEDTRRVVDKMEARVSGIKDEQDKMLEGIKKMIVDIRDEFDDRMRAIEEAPAKRVMSDREMARKQVLTAIIAGVIALLGSGVMWMFSNAIK